MSMNVQEKKLSPLKQASGYALCLAGFVLTLVAFSPGLMSPDSIDQWEQGRAWNFYDYHPPMMSALWGILDRIWPGPFLMLVFHNLLLWGGAALFWRLMKTKSFVAALAFACLGFMPQVLAPLTTIWKDIGLGGSLLVVAALLYAADQKRSRTPLFWSVPLMFYASGARLNAATATLPLALWSGVIVCRLYPSLCISVPARVRAIAPVMVGLLYLFVLLLAVNLTTNALTVGKVSFPYQQVLLHDLAGISKATGHLQFPSYLVENGDLTMEQVSKTYAPCSVNSLIYGKHPLLKLTINSEQVAQLRDKWKAAVISEPATYFSHRAAVFACLTGFNTDIGQMTFFPATGKNNPPPIKSPMNALTRFLTNYFFFFSHSALFRGFFWLLLSAGIVYLSLRLRLDGDMELGFVLASSGLLYGLGYFFYGPSSEFRYFWWTVLATSVATILFVIYLQTNWSRLRGAKGVR